MNRLKEHKGINLLLRYKKEILRRMDCLLDLDYHYMVLRRDYGNRFVITEFCKKHCPSWWFLLIVLSRMRVQFRLQHSRSIRFFRLSR